MAASAGVKVRAGLVAVALLAALALPILWLTGMGATSGVAVLGERVAAGFVGAVEAVGWVFVPQFLLAVAIFSLALQRLSARLAGASLGLPPTWLDPAVESALLLGLLGTISGMVQGFVGITPEELEPGPLVHSLGAALRSSFVGFAIALVGVWAKASPR